MFYWHIAQAIADERHAEARHWRLIRVARSARRHDRRRTSATARRNTASD
jgi:hypothetical protein